MRLQVLIVAANLFLAAPLAAGIRLSLTPAETPSRCDGHAIVTLRCATPVCAAAVVSKGVDIPGDVAFDVDRSAGWSAVVARDGCWAPEVRLDNASPDDVRVRLWPAATLTGTFALPHPQLSKEVRVRIQGAPETSGATLLAPVEISCPITEGKWRCRVPAMRLDARVQVNDYAPIYFWGRRAEPGHVLDVGEGRLEPGASIVGWVDSPRARKSSKSAEVELRVRAFVGEGRHPQQLTIAAMTTQANERGFFQFRNVPLGAYAIAAHAGDDASSELVDVDVDAPVEVQVRKPLLLVPPLPLTVRITPRMGPEAQPWKVRLQRPVPGSNFLAPVTESAARDDGTWISTAAVGQYVLSVMDARGSVHHRETLSIDLAPPTITVDLPLVEVAGTVKAGTRPIRGALTFSARDGASATLRADRDGHFSGVLPRIGRWTVRIHPFEERMYFSGISVDVQKPADGEVAKIDIDLPAGSVRGRVTDQGGNGVEADVQLFQDGHLIAVAASSSNGAFEVYGLPVGLATVHAEDDDAESAVVPLSITDSGDTTINLIVARSRSVQGFVSTRSGRPVSGALIRYLGTSFLELRETTTGPSGEFTLSVPAETAILDCVVIAGGLPTTIRRLSLEPRGGSIDLVIDETAGVLKIALGRVSIRPFIGKDGAFVALSMLFPPRAGGPPPGFTNDGYEARLAPGAYEVCPAGVRSRECRTFVLAPMSFVVADITGASESSVP